MDVRTLGDKNAVYIMGTPWVPQSYQFDLIEVEMWASGGGSKMALGEVQLPFSSHGNTMNLVGSQLVQPRSGALGEGCASQG